MYKKIDGTIHGNWSYIQTKFSAYMTQITGKTSPPFEKS
jgi:hypothetical protein